MDPYRSMFGPPDGSTDRKDDGPFLLTARDAARRLSISERTLFAMTSSGEIPCVRIGRLVRYSVETLKKWITQHESTDHEPMPLRPSLSRPEPEPQPEPSHRPKSRRPERGARASSANAPPPAPAVPKRASSKNPRESKPEERTDPFFRLVKGLGIDHATLPPMTNGELMRIAGVDLVEFHGWQHLGKTLPEEALEKLRDYVQRIAETS